jgi:predicted nucleic acid-binding protein
MLSTRYVFLDTNIYVQYLPYYKAEVLLHKLQTVKLIVTQELLTEINRVAFYPFIMNQILAHERPQYIDYVQKIILKIKAFADIFVEQPIPISLEAPIDDPNDWYITNVCLQYNCTLVTADKHFTTWSEAPFPVMTPAVFFNLIG